MKIPILADITKQISRDYGVLLPDGFALRGTFIIDPKGVLRQITVNDTPVGRNLDETLRLVEALQYADKHGEVCPVGWTKGARTMKVQRDVLVCVRVGREGKGSRLKVWVLSDELWSSLQGDAVKDKAGYFKEVNQ